MPGGFLNDQTWAAVRPLVEQCVPVAQLRHALTLCCTPEWLECARYLFAFLCDVAANAERNKMTVENLAQVAGGCGCLPRNPLTVIDQSFSVSLHPQVPMALNDASELQLLRTFTARCIADVKHCLFREAEDDAGP